MSKFKFALLISCCLLMSLFLHWGIVSSQAPQNSVLLTTQPNQEKILPFEAEAKTEQIPVKLSLQAVSSYGKPLENANINLTIFNPSKTPWWTTDFPIVEGTKLLELNAFASQGKLELEQLFPIRGNYRVEVKVNPVVPNSFIPIEQNLNLSVRENSLKYRNLAFVAAILLAVGFIGGWVINSSNEILPTEIVSEKVRFLLSIAILIAIATLLTINIRAEMAREHHHTHSASQDNSVAVIENLQAKLAGNDGAIVGQPASFKLKVMDSQTQQPVSNQLVKIKSIALEDNWVAFAYQGVTDNLGEINWQQGFFDGAPHKISAEITPELQLSKEIEVEGVAPPIAIKLIVLGYSLGVLLLGLVLGFKTSALKLGKNTIAS